MALSDEQNAMLRLLARGEQGYADIAALLGLGEAEVRAKVVGALAQLQAEGKPVPDIPSPTAGTDEAPAEPPQPASGPVAEPPAPHPAPAPAPTPPPSATPRAAGRTITLPTGRSAWLLGGGIAAVIAAIVVVIVLVSGGSSTGSTDRAAGGAEGRRSASTSAAKQPTEARLRPVDGSDAAGRATFGRVKNKLALQVEATGLEPTVEGTDSYTVWLAASPRRMLPLAFPLSVKGSGKSAGEIATQFEVPVAILEYLANGTFDQIAITRTDDKRLEAAVKVASKKKTAPAYRGKAVLRGKITGPIVGLAIREKEAKETENGK